MALIAPSQTAVNSPCFISLAITAHRGGRMLTACLDSAAKLDPPPREVIVTIDGNDKQVARETESRGFRAVPCPSAPGVSAARNAGVNAATGDFVAFADSDVLLRPDHMAQAARAFAENPDASAIFGSYDDEPGGFDESYRLPSVEDIELGYRLCKAGHGIRLVPDWQVKHLKKWTWRDLVFTDIGRRAIPWTRLLRREGRLDNDLNIDRSAHLSAAMVCLAILTIVAAMFRPSFIILAILALAVTTIVNFDFYRFLARRGGWAFAALALPLHWFYFLGATAGFIVGQFGSHRDATRR